MNIPYGLLASLFGQDGGILTKFFFASLWTKHAEGIRGSINTQKKNEADIAPS